MAEVIGLQSTEPRRNQDGSLEDRHRAKAKGAGLRKSENRSQDWRSGSQPDDRTRAAQVLNAPPEFGLGMGAFRQLHPPCNSVI